MQWLQLPTSPTYPCLLRFCAVAGHRLQFEQRKTCRRHQAALFLLGNFLPRTAAFAAFTSYLQCECLMIVVKELCQPFRGYFVNPHTVVSMNLQRLGADFLAASNCWTKKDEKIE